MTYIESALTKVASFQAGISDSSSLPVKTVKVSLAWLGYSLLGITSFTAKMYHVALACFQETLAKITPGAKNRERVAAWAANHREAAKNHQALTKRCFNATRQVWPTKAAVAPTPATVIVVAPATATVVAAAPATVLALPATTTVAVAPKAVITAAVNAATTAPRVRAA